MSLWARSRPGQLRCYSPGLTGEWGLRVPVTAQGWTWQGAPSLSRHLQGRTPCPGTAEPPLAEAELGMVGPGLGSRPDEMI